MEPAWREASSRKRRRKTAWSVNVRGRIRGDIPNQGGRPELQALLGSLPPRRLMGPGSGGRCTLLDEGSRGGQAGSGFVVSRTRVPALPTSTCWLLKTASTASDDKSSQWMELPQLIAVERQAMQSSVEVLVSQPRAPRNSHIAGTSLPSHQWFSHFDAAQGWWGPGPGWPCASTYRLQVGQRKNLGPASPMMSLESSVSRYSLPAVYNIGRGQGPN